MVIIGYSSRILLISSGSTIATTFASQDPNRELTEYETESGFFNEEGYINAGQHTRHPPINPDFAPDESCDFDAYQLKCIPGSEQNCPDGFAQNVDETCNPKGGLKGLITRIHRGQ